MMTMGRTGNTIKELETRVKYLEGLSNYLKIEGVKLEKRLDLISDFLDPQMNPQDYRSD